MSHKKYSIKEKRALRVRREIRANSDRLRLSVFRSNKHLYAQVIDDASSKTLVGFSSTAVEGANKTEIARAFGKLFAKKAKEHNVSEVVFDRGAYKYHGRLKAFADAVREEGLKF